MKKWICLFICLAGLAYGQGYGVATISAGQSLSDAVEVKPLGRAGYCTLATIVMPSAWTTASITFQGSIDGTTFGDLYDDGGEVVISTAAASRVIAVPSAYFWGLRWIKIRSGTAGSPVAQASARTIQIICR